MKLPLFGLTCFALGLSACAADVTETPDSDGAKAHGAQAEPLPAFVVHLFGDDDDHELASCAGVLVAPKVVLVDGFCVYMTEVSDPSSDTMWVGRPGNGDRIEVVGSAYQAGKNVDLEYLELDRPIELDWYPILPARDEPRAADGRTEMDLLTFVSSRPDEVSRMPVWAEEDRARDYFVVRDADGRRPDAALRAAEAAAGDWGPFDYFNGFLVSRGVEGKLLGVASYIRTENVSFWNGLSREGDDPRAYQNGYAFTRLDTTACEAARGIEAAGGFGVAVAGVKPQSGIYCD